MVYTIDEIEKIIAYKTWSVKRKTDKLLEMDCTMYCNLGTDSTKLEKRDVRTVSRKIYTAIKNIDINMGTLFLQSMDSNKTKHPL
tara:strand:+ start:917 stop:1171 length:255 start_codon:yes stop_codon:yes gene_type:complete